MNSQDPTPASYLPQAVETSDGLIADGRRALYHPSERWLAVADLHFGYELSQRSLGNAFPLWGREQIAESLSSLIAHHNPKTLVIVGDLLHSAAGETDALELIRTLESLGPILILIRGNHDRRLATSLRETLLPCWSTPTTLFHHGDFPPPDSAVAECEREVCGHLHPAIALADGARRLTVPAHVRTGKRWVLPAFSP